jgi:5-(carboxyamino)imidazole ribonucleotide synthase
MRYARKSCHRPAASESLAYDGARGRARVSHASILPGATIGFLGGGQLGRMTALAAREMGYDVRVLDPEANCPASPIATETIVAGWDDVEAATRLARSSDVVTIEIERVGVACLEATARYVPTHPGAPALAIVQHRARQKDWLVSQGFPVGEYREAGSAAECAAAVTAWGPCYIKASTGGYDGRGQIRVSQASECEDAWRALRASRCVVERALALDVEISVMVARRPAGDQAVFPVALNHHDAGQLAWSVIPAPIDPAIAARATEIGVGVAAALGVVGLLAIEMFVLRDGRLLINELAPRPHNSFHHTVEACVTSQFEQLVRAVCNLPLGATDIVRPAAIANVLGDAWSRGRAPDFAAALGVPGTRMHLYGKHDPRPARKMGHLAAVADTPENARAAVLDALHRLRRGA